MRTMCVFTLAVVALVAGGCSSNSDAPSGQASPSKSSCAPSDDSCIPPDHPSASALAVPALRVGQSMQLQLPTSGGTVQARITLTGLKTKSAGPEDKPDTKTLCFGFKLRNTGTTAFGSDGAGLSWTWFGLDGQQSDTDPGTAGMCDELGHEFAGMDGPAPQPGKWVPGYYSMSVPAKAGALEVTDSDGTPLFRLNYGPESVQVPIDAAGQ